MSLDLGKVLDAINATEGSPLASAAPKPPNTVSGKYQFTDSTWLSNGGGAYAPSAYKATAAQQDAIAGAKVQSIMAANPGRGDDDMLNAIADNWYIGHTASAAERAAVPRPDAGNKLTVAQYEAKLRSNYGGGGGQSLAGKILSLPGDILGSAADGVAGAVSSALGAIAAPVLEGLRKLTILGLTVGLGLVLVVLGSWRSVKAPANG